MDTSTHRRLKSILLKTTLLISPFLIALLPLSTIPSQLSSNAVDPVLAPSALRHYVRERVSASTDRHVISWSQLNSFSAIETCPTACPCIVRNSYAEDNCIRKDDGPEGEGMSADGSHKNDWVFRVAERAASGKTVGC